MNKNVLTAGLTLLLTATTMTAQTTLRADNIDEVMSLNLLRQ